MKLQERAGKKRTSPKTDLLMRRLTAYSATAGAALMVVPVTDAAIQNITTFSYDGGNTFSITPPDLTGNPPNSFQSIVFTGATAGHGFGFYGALGASHFSNSIANGGYVGIYCSTSFSTSIAATFNGFKAINLSFDAPIAGATNFGRGSLILASRSRTVGSSSFFSGSFVPNGNNVAKTGYIGFRYGTSYYGWLRVKVVNDGNGLPFEVSLVDKNGDGIYGAFGLASDNIRAGEIAGVPEPSVAAIGGLGLLALGAVGVRELRQRRKVAAQK